MVSDNEKKPIGSFSSLLSSCFSLAQNCYCKIVFAFLNNLLEVPEAGCNCTLMDSLSCRYLKEENQVFQNGCHLI